MKRRWTRRAALLAIWALMPPAAEAGARWTFGGYIGSAWNIPTPLEIRQSGFDAVRVRARYGTHAFEFPIYYGVRLERTSGDDGWAVQFIHHKIRLLNRPPEVQAFEISHGYNLLTLERAWRSGERVSGVGLGVVIAHPESRVRGREVPWRGGLLGSSYHLAGPAASAMVAWRHELGSHEVGGVEARLSGALARVPVAGGSADAPNVALHGLAGAGYRP